MTAPLNTSPAIIVRKTKNGLLFLDWNYKWTTCPEYIIFTWWHLKVALRSAPKATGYALVDPSQPIDLDKLEIVKI